MTTRTRFPVPVLFVVATLLLAGLAGPGAGLAAAQGMTMTVEHPGSVEVDESVSTPLEVTGVSDTDGVGSYEVTISYDSNAVSVTASDSGAFTVTTDSPSAGTLTLVGYTGQYPGPTGEVALASLDITGESETSSTTLDVSIETLTDADGNSLSASPSDTDLAVIGGDGDDTTTPTPTPTDGTDEQDEQTGDGGAGGGGGAPAISPPPQDAGVSVSQPDTDTVRASFEEISQGEAVTASLPQTGAATDTGVSLTGMSVSTSEDVADVTMDVSQGTSPPGDAPDLAVGESGTDAVSYLDIQHNLEEEQFSQVELTFEVSEESLNQRNQLPQNVRLFRFDEGAGSWESFTPNFAFDSARGVYEFSATVDHLSVFAIGVRQPNLAIVSASLGRSTTQVGNAVAVTADIENTGRGVGTFTAALSIDGDILSSQQIEVDPGRVRTVTFDTTFAAPGTYEVAINGTTAGTLTVQAPGGTGTSAGPGTAAAAGPGDTPGAQPASPTGEPAGIDMLPVIAGLVVLVALFGALYLYRERE